MRNLNRQDTHTRENFNHITAAAAPGSETHTREKLSTTSLLQQPLAARHVPGRIPRLTIGCRRFLMHSAGAKGFGAVVAREVCYNEALWQTLY
jgi:hypothetical protein